MKPSLIDVVYLVASGLMLAGIWKLFQPGKSKQGNLLGGAGVLLAVLATLAAPAGISLAAAAIGLAIGCGLGAFLGMRATSDNAMSTIALLVSAVGLSSALVAGATIHTVGAVHDAAIAERDKDLKGLPENIKRANGGAVEIPVLISMSSTAAAALAAMVGGAVASAGAICFLKLSRSPIRKALIKFEEPRMIQNAMLLVCLVLGVLLILLPGAESFLWLLLICTLGLGYALTIHLKISDTPPILAALMGASGVSIAAAGCTVGNLFMVTGGGIVAAGGAALAHSMSSALGVTVPGLIFGTQTSKGAAEEAETPAKPLPPIATPTAPV